MQAPNDISHLIVSYLKSELNKDQEDKLYDWLKDSTNRELFAQITSKEKILGKSFEYDKFDQNKAWAKLDKKIAKETDYRKWLSYVAVILLLFTIGFSALNKIKQTKKHQPKLAEIQPISPGESNAVIYFSNGEMVNLKSDTSRVIHSQENLLVERENNQIRIKDDQLLSSCTSKMNRIVTPIGAEYMVELPDGTKVWLNADSYLEFPSKFSKKERKVIVKGELYFDVEKNEDWPFIVETKGMELKVLGTEFNVRAYEEESEIVSTLVEGSVLVYNSIGKNIVLAPGYQAIIAKSNNSIGNVKANIEETIAWKNGRFIFDNTRVEDIMYDLSRWYNVKVFFANSSIKEKHFSVNVQRYGNIEDILKLIQGTGEVQFTIKENVITVR